MSTRSVQDELDKNFSISIQHLPSGKIVSFSAFIESFSDSYKQKWESEEVYGRMDPIYYYKNTTRNIIMDFSVPSENLLDAQSNFKKISNLIRFSYPTYETPKSFTEGGSTNAQAPATTAKQANTADAIAAISANPPNSISNNALLISSPPLIAINFANLITTPVNNGRLIGKLNSVSYAADKDTTFYSIGKNLFPSVYKIKLEFDPIHSTALGWQKNGPDGKTVERNKKFPYGV
jgi:hypothetical protein